MVRGIVPSVFAAKQDWLASDVLLEYLERIKRAWKYDVSHNPQNDTRIDRFSRFPDRDGLCTSQQNAKSFNHSSALFCNGGIQESKMNDSRCYVGTSC